jgi:DNA-directed RNA polymerase subunit omega
MARITIEDCIEQVPNRFQLIQMTAIRTKQLKKGARALVKSEDNKAVVVALREIAAGLVTPDRPLDSPDLEVESAASEEAAPSEATPESTKEA